MPLAVLSLGVSEGGCVMEAALEHSGQSREDRLWEAAVAQLTAEGVMAQEQASVLLERHQSIEQVSREQSRRAAVIELAGYVGAALTISGIAAISSQVWGDFTEVAQILVLGALAAGFLNADSIHAVP